MFNYFWILSPNFIDPNGRDGPETGAGATGITSAHLDGMAIISLTPCQTHALGQPGKWDTPGTPWTSLGTGPDAHPLNERAPRTRNGAPRCCCQNSGRPQNTTFHSRATTTDTIFRLRDHHHSRPAEAKPNQDRKTARGNLPRLAKRIVSASRADELRVH